MTAERALQTETMLRLRALGVVALAVPNALHLPRRSAAEGATISRVVHQMKATGMLTPGAPDLVVAGSGRCCFVELKRPKARDMLGKTQAAGVLSESQKLFRAQCDAAGVAYRVCHSWDEVEAALTETGVLAPLPSPAHRAL